jgi:hypothetical protein
MVLELNLTFDLAERPELLVHYPDPFLTLLLVFIPQTRTTLCEKLLLDAVRGEVGC